MKETYPDSESFDHGANFYHIYTYTMSTVKTKVIIWTSMMVICNKKQCCSQTLLQVQALGFHGNGPYPVHTLLLTFQKKCGTETLFHVYVQMICFTEFNKKVSDN